MSESMFAVQADYYVPLLRVLADMPKGQAGRRDVFNEISRRYAHLIPESAHASLPSNPRAIKWEHDVEWARQKLIRYGLMYAPAHGVWGITMEGRGWLSDHPGATHIDRMRGQGREESQTHRASAPSRTATTQFPGINLEMLEHTRQVMGEDAFRPLWGTLYDQLLSAERAKAITEVSDDYLAKSARRQVRQIQHYLQGRNKDRPTGEQICDWIHFCYQFSLFREAAALFPLVNADEVVPWYFERARRIVMTAKAK